MLGPVMGESNGSAGWRIIAISIHVHADLVKQVGRVLQVGGESDSAGKETVPVSGQGQKAAGWRPGEGGRVRVRVGEKGEGGRVRVRVRVGE